jgi:hypothetical protein
MIGADGLLSGMGQSTVPAGRLPSDVVILGR